MPVDLSLDGLVVSLVRSAQRIVFQSHFEGRADGSKRDLNGLSFDSSSIAGLSSPDPFSEAHDCADVLFFGATFETRVHLKTSGEFDPMVPMSDPFLVIRSHDASVCCVPRSSE